MLVKIITNINYDNKEHIDFINLPDDTPPDVISNICEGIAHRNITWFYELYPEEND
jgi:hypothetical protein